MFRISFLVTFFFIIFSLSFWLFPRTSDHLDKALITSPTSLKPIYSPTPVLPTDATALTDIPPAKVLSNDFHVFQTFNNCAPAALSMALSYFDIKLSQKELGEQMRPYQNPQGDNDDKSVTLKEVAIKAEELGLKAYLRPNGDITKIKQFIAAGFPVIARTYLKPGEDIGHYRIIKGYNDTTQEITQDDSLQGKNLQYSYSDFDRLWADFNYEYLLLVPNKQQQTVEQIIGEDIDEELAWQKAVARLEKKLSQGETNSTVLFNLSVSKYHTKDYIGSVEAFEKVENQLSSRTLWYQIEPIMSYYQLGNYSRVIEISDQILNNQNRAFSELYLLKAQVYIQRGEKSAAAEQLALAKFYNRNIKITAQLLEAIN